MVLEDKTRCVDFLVSRTAILETAVVEPVVFCRHGVRDNLLEDLSWKDG